MPSYCHLPNRFGIPVSEPARSKDNPTSAEDREWGAVALSVRERNVREQAARVPKTVLRRRYALAALLVALVGLGLSAQFRARIWTDSQLEAWCKARTEQYLIARGDHPTNWTVVFYSTLGDDRLHVWARWSLGLKSAPVMCVVTSWAKADNAGFEVGTPE